MLAPALTILLSSFLLFLVQPIIAKQILPWFGGSASVWIVCLVFFQSVLVLGYAYAHVLTRRGAGSRQFTVHLVLLLGSCLALPIIPAAHWRQSAETPPAATILGLLAVTVGLPYLLLASTSPLLQKWLTTAPGGSALGPSVYRLFALSNFGSLLGLLAYPFGVEPFAPLRAQAWGWSGAYLVFALSSMLYAGSRWRKPVRADEPGDPPPAVAAAPAPRRYAYWIACSALGSMLLLAVTNHITQNVAAVPLLWIVPLALYLLSFTVCFEGRAGDGWYQRRLWVTPAMLAAAAMAWALWTPAPSVYLALPLYAAGVFFGCVMCHGELARSKPPTQYMTHFYLSLAAGGALGGIFVGLVAPWIFSGYWELALAIVALTVLGLYCAAGEQAQRPRSWAVNVALALLAAALILALLGDVPRALAPYTAPWSKILEGDARWGCAALLVACALLAQRHRLWPAVPLAALLCAAAFGAGDYRDLSAGAVYATRNFYGALRVMDVGQVRRLVHGTIVHGSQVKSGAQKLVPTTYYGVSSGIGRALAALQLRGEALRVGSVGLGAGTLAAYGRPGDVLRVYEINPAVVDIARTRFTYLSDSKARVEVVLGDARLSLEGELAGGRFDAAAQRFDVLSLDAFSGDAIPVHLLTREALAIYARVIKADGVIAVHVSNLYLDLAPVVAQLARDAGFEAALLTDRPPAGLLWRSQWVLVTHDDAFLRQPGIAAYSSAIPAAARSPLWTDQFTDLLRVLR